MCLHLVLQFSTTAINLLVNQLSGKKRERESSDVVLAIFPGVKTLTMANSNYI